MDVINFLKEHWKLVLILLVMSPVFGVQIITIGIIIGFFVGIYYLIRYIYNKLYQKPYHRRH